MSFSKEENQMVDQALNEAKWMDGKLSADIYDEAFKGQAEPATIFEKVDTDYPQVLDDQGVKLPSKEIKRLHDDYINRMTMAMLTYSLFSASGNQPPRGYVVKEDVAERILRKMKWRVRFVKGMYEVELVVPGMKATIEDPSRHCAILRALHFIGTRNDPDLEEYIVRRLAEQIGRTEQTAIAL